MYKAKVKYNGNHYDAGQEVRGSKIRTNKDGTVELFDDEPIEEFPFYGEGRDEWVEVEPKSIKKVVYYFKEFYGHENYMTSLIFDTEKEAYDYLYGIDENPNFYDLLTKEVKVK